MKKPNEIKSRKAKRELFADGSALITYPDGGMLIVESDLARQSAFSEEPSGKSTINYAAPPPPPPHSDEEQ
jgi:hypothetical protein